MTSYRHTVIAERIRKINTPPVGESERSSWVRAEKHLQLLRQNATGDEVILYTSSRQTFVHAVVANESDVTPPDHDDLLEWNDGPSRGRAYYVWDEVEERAGMESGTRSLEPKTMQHSRDLVFARNIEGVSDTAHYELLQEFAHAEDIHWRGERHAYCTIDENGDWKSVVSVTDRSSGDFVLITCQRESLERYLVATGGILVQFFDLTMIPVREEFRGWGKGPVHRIIESDALSYKQYSHPDGYGYVRGVQLLPILSHQESLFHAIMDRPMAVEREHADFIISDWRNGGVTEVSAAPRHTVNYFNAEGNSLPFEVSPAFFKPEVLSKYKADRDKYTVNERNRTINCRGAWYLKNYDINDAGQVHAYLCDLRHLPYQEQLHWKSHNEEPKGPISKRAYENDFVGQWSSDATPLEKVLDVVSEWAKQKFDWWHIEDEELSRRVNTPVADSRDEWGTAFLELSKVVIEGFRKKPIQALLRQENVPFENSDGTLALLEKLISSQAPEGERPVQLRGLKQAQLIRTKVHSHSGGSEADEATKEALMEYGTYRGHFEQTCDQIADELGVVEEVLRTVC